MVARPTADGFRVVDAFSRIIRLGEGVAASRPHQRSGDRARGRGALGLSRQDAGKGRDARAAYRHGGVPRRRERRGIPQHASPREAGLELEIINSATEARLAATGCTELFDPTASSVILFDIGGGSSELVRLIGSPGNGRRGPPTPDIVGWASLPVGVVTLAERYGGKVVSPDTYDAMVEEVAGFRR